MAYTQLKPRHTSGANVVELSNGNAYRLSIPAGAANQYRLSQLDDYAKLRRNQFLLRPPITLRLSARTSSNVIPGTWGFGLWNDPFGLSLGFGGNPFRLPALPNAVWFFGASKENYLSFRETAGFDKQEKGTLATQPARREEAANGFIAQVFRAPRFHPSLISAGLAFPFSRKKTRRILGKVIDEDGIALSVDPTQWHRYRLDWRESGMSFAVDDAQIFESSISPHSPLGLVIWIDNQYAAFTPEGKIGFGVLENPEPAWLEIKDINLA